ncbi:MAG: hypothetical protein CMI95_05855 [Pelagibacteraceae bacterium]|nr:hypothetical protein [Pelagibacteraceae bacterium]|tara:strand:+ start:129 stop:1505 length:1377 start_codon:yes stop_codon:yes gene_type:complete
MKSLNLTKPNILNLLVCLFPLTFVLGNLFINIWILLVTLLGIFFYRDKLFTFAKINLLLLISLFFLTLIISTILEDIRSDNNHLTKSILYLRYLLLLIVIRCMILKGDLNFKQFLLSCLILSTIIAADVIFQYFVGVNVLGYEATAMHRSGVFKTEAVAGGYIQRFLVLGLFSIPLLFYKNKNKIILFLALTVTVGFLGIIFSGNRMPTVLFVFFIFLSSLIIGTKKFKSIKIIFLLFIISLFTMLMDNSERINKAYSRFYGGVSEMAKIIPEVRKKYPELEIYKNSGKPFYETEGYKYWPNYNMFASHTGHALIYITSVDLFKDSPVIGRGIKSFRNTCREKWHLPNRLCQLHPHHFYLEILNDTGIVGFSIITIALIFLFIKNFNKYYKNNKKKIKSLNLTFYAVSLAIIIEFVPFRSHGSFFSTTNAAYVFFLLGIFAGLAELEFKKISKKKLDS